MKANLPLNIWVESPYGTMHRVGTVDLEVENGVEIDLDNFLSTVEGAFSDAG